MMMMIMLLPCGYSFSTIFLFDTHIRTVEKSAIKDNDFGTLWMWLCKSNNEILQDRMKVPQKREKKN